MATVLESTKEYLGFPVSETAFDNELLLAINTALSTLNQVGVGPEDPVVATTETDWSLFIGDRTDLEQSKMYVAMQVKIMFDPPASTTILEALKRTADELLWRLNRIVEGGSSDDDV